MDCQEFLEYLIGVCNQSDEDGYSYIGAAWLRGLCQQELNSLATGVPSWVTGGPVPIEGDDPEEVIGVEWEY